MRSFRIRLVTAAVAAGLCLGAFAAVSASAGTAASAAAPVASVVEDARLLVKVVELRTVLKGKIDALNPDAKAFVDGAIEKIRALRPKGDERPTAATIRAVFHELQEQYNALSPEAKQSLEQNLPLLRTVLFSVK